MYLAGLVGFIVSAVLWGLWRKSGGSNRRVGDAPCCAQCERLLTQADLEVARCSKCELDLALLSAIVRGERRERRWRLRLAWTALVIGWLAVGMQANIGAILRWAPDRIVIFAASTKVVPEAQQEFDRRVQVRTLVRGSVNGLVHDKLRQGLLDAEAGWYLSGMTFALIEFTDPAAPELIAMIDELLVLHVDPSVHWKREYSMLIEQGRRSGVVDDARWATYLDNAMAPRLRFMPSGLVLPGGQAGVFLELNRRFYQLGDDMTSVNVSVAGLLPAPARRTEANYQEADRLEGMRRFGGGGDELLLPLGVVAWTQGENHVHGSVGLFSRRPQSMLGAHPGFGDGEVDLHLLPDVERVFDFETRRQSMTLDSSVPKEVQAFLARFIGGFHVAARMSRFHGLSFEPPPDQFEVELDIEFVVGGKRTSLGQFVMKHALDADLVAMQQKTDGEFTGKFKVWDGVSLRRFDHREVFRGQKQCDVILTIRACRLPASELEVDGLEIVVPFEGIPIQG